MILKIKPLSVNQAWMGRKFKTPAYKKFETEMLLRLPFNRYVFEKHMNLTVFYRFGFSSKLSDLGNPEKLVTDILCKKYGFDDRQIYEMRLEKVDVKKGEEFIEIEISEIFQQNRL